MKKIDITTNLIFALCTIVVIARFAMLDNYRPLTYPNGSDWSQYIMGAEYIWQADSSLHYPEYRSPLYPYLLGLFSFDSYIHSAMTIAWIGWGLCATGLVLFACSFGRGMVVLSLLALSLFPLFPESIHYMNPYPLIGGLCAMNAGAIYRQRHHDWWGWTAIAFFFGALAISADTRCSISVLCSTLLWGRFRSVNKGLLIGSGLVFLVAGFHLWLQKSFAIPLLSLTEKLAAQRAFLFRESMVDQLFPAHPQHSWLASICVGSPASISEVGTLWSDCSLAMLHINLEAWQFAGLLPPALFGLVALAALRKKEGWPLVSTVVLYLLLSLVVWQPSRYVFFILFPLYAVLVMGAVQCSQWMGQWSKIGACVLFGSGLLMWPRAINSDGFLSRDYPLSWPKLLPQIHSHIADEVPLDCSGQDLLISQLSAHRKDDRPLLPSAEYCDRQFRERNVTQILSSSSKPRVGWLTVDSWRFEKGVVWLYAIDNK